MKPERVGKIQERISAGMENHDDFGNSILFNPPIRVTEDGRNIRVSVGLPGIAEEQIRIALEKTTFTVSISERETMVQKTIQVPCEVRFFKKNFSDGMLEIFLEKQGA